MKQSIAFGIEKIGAPCVIVKCNGQDLFFLIDTGSSENHLVEYTHLFFTKYFDDVIKEEEGSVVTKGVAGSIESKKCSFAFSIGRTQYEDSFVILPNSEVFIGLSERMGEPLAGILGGRFLKKNGIVIDYGSQCVYTKRRKKGEKATINAQEAA